MDIEPLVRLILLGILLLFSAFFSACEAAFFSLNKARVGILSKSPDRARKRVALLLEQPRRLLVTIYIGNEIVNVGIAAITTLLVLDFFGERSPGLALDIGLAISIGTLLLLVFGEISPKTYAINHSEGFSVFAAYPLWLFSLLIRPVQYLITGLANRVVYAFGGSPAQEKSMLTQEELKTLVGVGMDEGIIEGDEKEMIHSVVELGETNVSEVMTPRTEMFAVEDSTPIPEIKRLVGQNRFSRIPVYSGNVDNMVGVLYSKDLLADNTVDTRLRDNPKLVRQPFFVPETKKLNDLLREFLRQKIHLAIVLDEYGGVQGLVTLDNILEEVVGEMGVDLMKEEPMVLKVGKNHFLVSGRMPLEEFNEKFDTHLDHEGVDTLGGYVFHLFGRLPKWGEEVEENDLKFTVRKMRGRQIRLLSLRIADKEPR